MPRSQHENALAGCRILSVEDEYLLASELDRAVKAAGAAVLGPVPTVEEALGLLNGDTSPDVATIDNNLRGQMAYTLADELKARGVPFLFTTGYDQAVLPERHAAVCRMEKPVDTQKFMQELGRLRGSVDTPSGRKPHE